MNQTRPKDPIRVQSAPSAPRPVLLDSHGRIFEMTGERIVMAGLEPEAILEGLADIEAGRTKTLAQIVADRK